MSSNWKHHVDAVPAPEGGATMPFIQWVNDPGKLEPRQARGGFAQPEESLEMAGDLPQGAEMVGFMLKNNTQLTVAYTPQLRAAILATRFAWVKDGEFVPDYVEGARSKLQAYALIAGETGPFISVLTFTGMSGKAFSEALKAHRARVKKLSREAGQEANSAMFYATLCAGEPKLEGKKAKSLVSPVEGRAEELDLDVAFVGADALALVDWAEVDTWKKAWKDVKGPNGDGVVEDEEEEVPVTAPLPAAAPAPATAPALLPAAASASSSPLAPVDTSGPAADGTQRILTALMRGKGYDAGVITATLDGITVNGATALLEELKTAA